MSRNAYKRQLFTVMVVTASALYVGYHMAAKTASPTAPASPSAPPERDGLTSGGDSDDSGQVKTREEQEFPSSIRIVRPDAPGVMTAPASDSGGSEN